MGDIFYLFFVGYEGVVADRIKHQELERYESDTDVRKAAGIYSIYYNPVSNTMQQYNAWFCHFQAIFCQHLSKNFIVSGDLLPSFFPHKNHTCKILLFHSGKVLGAIEVHPEFHILHSALGYYYIKYDTRVTQLSCFPPVRESPTKLKTFLLFVAKFDVLLC